MYWYADQKGISWIDVPLNTLSYNVLFPSENKNLFLKGRRQPKFALITWPSFQEETSFKMALVFPSSSNRPLLFKAHACTGGISVINVRQIHWLRGKISLKCCREQKAAFLSVGSVNVVVLLPLLTIILVEMFKWYVLSRGDYASRNCDTNAVARFVLKIEIGVEIAGCEKKTTLKHYAVMVKYTPLECSSLSSVICQPIVFFVIYSSSKFI